MEASLPLKFVEGILSQLGTSSVPFLQFMCCFNDEKTKLMRSLEAAKAWLSEAEEQQDRIHSKKDSIEKLQLILYEAEDLVEEIILYETADVETRNIICSFFKTTIPYRIQMPLKLKAIRDRLAEFKADRAGLPSPPQRSSRENKETREEPQSYILPDHFIGREKDKEAIKNMIKECSSSVSTNNVPTVIAIIGIGGLGKTTLARSVYDDAEAFDLKIWVWVSQDFVVKDLVIKVIQASPGQNCKPTDSMIQLESKLRDCLDRKKYLLVLDDVWIDNHISWDKFGNLLKSTGAKGSVILATTRETTVASTIGAALEYQYPLKDLERDDCLSLFEQQLGFKLHQMEEKHISLGKEILKRCGGIPLAIMTVAGLLRYSDPETEWQSVKSDELWSQAQEDNHILPSLRVSYSRLPSNLKKCFAYCSLFHKGDEIEKAMLTQMWLAQGFTQQSSNKGLLVDSGDKCFKELRNRSFFQEVQKNDWGDVICCKMHDLMHDLAKAVAGSEYVTVNDEVIDNSDKIIHASVKGMVWSVDKILPTNARNLRTLLTVGIHSVSKQDLYKITSSFKCLRVLDVCGREIVTPAFNMPNSIEKLKHLRYLDLSRRPIRMLPDFMCELRYLQTLKLNHCIHLEELPGEIKKLVSLTHLENEKCSKLKGMPVGIGQLTSIQTLSLYVLGGKGSGGLRELENLNNLKGGLRIQNLHNARNTTSESRKALKKKNLQSLSFEWEAHEDDRERMHEGYRDEDVALLGSFQPSPYLKELSIDGYSGVKFPSWMDNIGESLPNIVSISLVNCPNYCACLPLFADQLRFLKFLSLANLPKLEYIHSYVSEPSSSPTVSSSSLFNSNISSEVATWFPALKNVYLKNLPKLKEWCRDVIVRGKPKTQSPAKPKLLLSLNTLSTLEIYECPELTSMPLLPNVEQLRLSKCSRALIESMTMAETTPTTSSLPSLLTHSKLMSIYIQNCNDLMSLPQGWLDNLNSLEVLWIMDCVELMSLSLETPNMLNDLKGKDVQKEDDLQIFTRLRWLYLSNLPKLTSLPKGLQYATNFKQLSIRSCDGLVSWLDSMGNITSLHSLSILGLRTLTYLPQGLRHLTALESLAFLDCPELNFSDDDNDTPIPTNLHSLILAYLPKLTFLPDWHKVLTSLQNLRISGCEELKSLPETISRLAALQRLEINRCPQLPEIHQRDNISPNIAHIPEIVIDWEKLRRKPII